ncbi:MAG: hypothetical protein IJE89_00690 [Bacilli bacterium]|nr:hypothetical protein [Bacilli bacterium]
MNNFIEYFYGIKVDKVIYGNKYYSFIYNGYVYRLYIVDSNINTKSLYEINKKLVGNTLMSEIIVNMNGEVISIYNDIDYILLKIFVNINKPISLEEISFISNSLMIEKINVNWGMLWSNKIDYLEDLINENGKKYPLIVDSFNYFVGMAENAISYFNSIITDNNYKYVISHKTIRWRDTVEALYNPLNIIFDYKVRDIAEYIKNSFFNNNYNIFNELVIYLRNNSLSLTDVNLLISRLLYPSFYFDMYEDILIDNKEEKIILDVISRLDEYEEYLSKVICFFKDNYDVYEIEWLKKRRN